MQFKYAGYHRRRKHGSPDQELDRVCARCHHRWGKHFGNTCPDEKGG